MKKMSGSSNIRNHFIDYFSPRMKCHSGELSAKFDVQV